MHEGVCFSRASAMRIDCEEISPYVIDDLLLALIMATLDARDGSSTLLMRSVIDLLPGERVCRQRKHLTPRRDIASIS